MDPSKYIQNFLKLKADNGTKYGDDVIKKFSEVSENNDLALEIINLQNQIMDNWKLKNKILDFERLNIVIPNGTQHKPYRYTFQTDFFRKNNIFDFLFEGLEDIGLNYNIDNCCIEGTPTHSGDLKIHLKYLIHGESESNEFHTKFIRLVINPDPKSLWKNLPSDKEGIYWKEDNRSSSAVLKDNKYLIASSKRGRSHQNVGTCRDDDYAYKYFERTGWTVVAVSDGAGSYPYSRKGSQVACDEIINYFSEQVTLKEMVSFENSIKHYKKTEDDETYNKAKKEYIQCLYKGALNVYNKIKALAEKTFEEHPELKNHPKAKNDIEYFHSTFIFSVFKKFDFGYIILSFSVGDCPIGMINTSESEATLINWLDVGEFGGGTRFITQQEIFTSSERPMQSRFSINEITDFSYLFLMTDGIYDAKFVVEANLEKTEKWKEFIADLKGENEDGVGVEFGTDLKKSESQLNEWMDFWSKGNHDDRTLAIIYSA